MVGFRQDGDISFGSFNVRGLSSKFKKHQLAEDLARYGVTLCALQETKIKDGHDEIFNQYRIFCLPSSNRHYGLGFAIHRNFQHRVHRIWSISDRVAVIQIRTSVRSLISYVNVYAPTSTRVAEDEGCLDEFYCSLNEAFSSIKSTSLILLAGDFNAKLGKPDCSTDGDEVVQCVGSYSRGRRNYSGTRLADFCHSKGLFACNTAFQHHARHQTTWTGWRHNNQGGPSLPIYNQIDYIFCAQSQKQLFTDARSYSGTTLNSDHRLVVARARLQRFYGVKGHLDTSRRNDQRPVKLNVHNFQDIEKKHQYQDELSSRMEEQNATDDSPDQQWKELSSTILTTAKEHIGVEQRPQRSVKFMDDQLHAMSEEKRRLRLLIGECRDATRIQELKHQRNQLSHRIRVRTKTVASEQIDKKVQEIEKKKDGAQMFHAVHLLQRRRQQPLSVHDNDGKLVIQQEEVAQHITSHFSKFFAATSQPQTPNMDPPQRERLSTPISTTEVSTAAKRLNNGRASGPDGMPGECLKYAPASVHRQIADLLNDVIETGFVLDSISSGSLIPLQKPGKSKGPVAHLRPIVLLTALRKILSSIVLRRINPKVNAFVSPTQSGFRPNRSTADVVWSYRWFAARSQRVRSSLHILGIDMSKAFDIPPRPYFSEGCPAEL